MKVNKGLKFHTIIPLILTLSLLGCQTTPADMTPPVPTASQTPIPTAAPTLTPTPTEVPLDALPVEEIVQKYLAGEIDDITNLTLEQQNAFRAELAEQLKASGSVHVVFDAGRSNPAYIDPETFTMRQLNDGRSEAEQSIQMYREVQVDSEGYLWVTNLQGVRVKIEGSAGVDWNEIITDPNSTSIKWSKTEPGNSGLPVDQWFLTLDKNTAYKRVLSLGKMVGNFFFKEFNGGRGSLTEILPFYMIVTDQQGNPLYARLVLVAPAGRLEYVKEGSDFIAGSRITELHGFGA
jgi:hypothetical protein